MKKIITLGLLLTVSLGWANINISSMSIGSSTKIPQIIKQNKMFGFTLGGSSDFVSIDSSSVKLIGSFAYQVFENFWGELSVGYSQVTDYPGEEIDTVLYSYAIKAKFALSGPWKSVIMPYMGLQLNSPYSPGAGQNVSEYTKNQELAAVENLKEVKPIFGFTILKLITKGWFARVDLGGDVAAAGITATF